MRKILSIIFVCLLLAGCAKSTDGSPTPAQTPIAPSPSPTAFQPAGTATLVPTVAPTQATPTALNVSSIQGAANTPAPGATLANQIAKTGGGIPAFAHIILIVFENHNYNEVIGSADTPTFNRLAQQNVLLTQYYAVAHPSLPNYLALIGGSTFGIKSDCDACYVDAPSLPDLLEATGRTWKTYQEDLPSPCFKGYADSYDLNHNPFIYFDPIRNNAARCQNSVVPLTQLSTDLANNQLPNFAFIVPNICNDAHSCHITTADQWLGGMIQQLQSSPALGQNSAIFILFDEASADNSSCCELPSKAGGRIPLIIISPLAKTGFQDDTPLDHYSLLKTILQAWNLPGLGETLNAATQSITAPWK